jgi:hypothetical protein
MSVVPYSFCGRPLAHGSDRRHGQRIYTPTPDGFERFLRLSVGLPADILEVFPVDQLPRRKVATPRRRGGRWTGYSITEEVKGWTGTNHR